MKKLVIFIIFLSMLLIAATIVGSIYVYNQKIQEMDKLRVSLMKREKELGQIKTNFKQAVFKNRLLSREKEELEKKIDLVKRSVLELGKEKSKINKEIEELLKEKELLIKGVKKVSQKADEKIEVEKKDFEKEIVAIQEKYMGQLKDANKEYEKLKKQMDVLDGRRELMENSITQAISDVGREKLKFYHYQLARAYEHKKSFEDAIKEYKKVLELDPNNADTYLQLASIYTYQIRDIYKAEFYAKKYAKLKALESEVKKNLEEVDEIYLDIPLPFLKEKLADVSFVNVSLENRIDYLQNKVSDNKKVISRLEAIAEKKKTIEKDLTELGEKMKKESLRYHYNLALAYDRIHDYENASKEYLEALKVNPDDMDTHYNLAIVYDDHLKDKRKAVTHYEKYLKLCSPTSPDVEKVQFWLARARAKVEFEDKDVINLRKLERGYNDIKTEVQKGFNSVKTNFLNATNKIFGPPEE